MKKLKKVFLRGLIFILPIVLSIYVLMWIGINAENFFGGMLKDFIGAGYYVPGFGIIITIFMVFVVGLLTGNFITGKLISYFRNLLEKIPFFKAIYRPLYDLMNLFGKDNEMSKQKVVFVNVNENMKMLGLITRENFTDLKFSEMNDEFVTVYMPLSYMFGGVTIAVKKCQLEEIDIPVEQAMKLAITGWIKTER